MAETVKVEIPIEAHDNTESGVNSAQRRLTSLERSMQKTQNQLDKLDRSHANIDIDAHDTASDKIAGVEDAVDKTNGMSANVGIGVDDAATAALNGVEDIVGEIDGNSAVVDVEADDAATGVLNDVDDKVSKINGSTATVEATASDSASGPLVAVKDLVDELSGMRADIPVNIVGSGAEGIKSLVASTAGVMGASFGVADSVNTFGGFEAGMSQVKAISGATADEMVDLTAKAKEMGATTKFTATESAEAMNYMAMAGWKPKQMLNGISGIMALAAASGESLASTSDIVTDAITAFNMKAEDADRFSDVLAAASANANTNVAMLGESFKYVGPVAGAMNYTIEDTALALGLMANAGVKSSMGGTALRRSISSLAAPTAKVAETMDKYGISLTDQEENAKSLSGVIENLRESLGGLDKTEKTAAVSTLFGSEAMAGMLAIINASESDYDKLESAIRNSTGAAVEMQNTMLDNMQGSFVLMTSAIDATKSELGERLAPYLESFAEWTTEIMPDATEVIDTFADAFDNKVSAMTNQENWNNTDFIGKVNIAWDTLIGEPLTDWMTGDGSHLFSQGLTSLLSSTGKVVTGKGKFTDVVGAILLGKGTLNAVSGVKGLADGIGALGAKVSATLPGVGSFINGLSGVIPIAASVTAGLAAVGAAIDANNQKEIEISLAKQFGHIDLSHDQAKDFASALLDADYTANISAHLGAFDGADEVRKQAEEVLAANHSLEWKCSVGLTLSEDEMQSYSDNIETFVTSKKEELEKQFEGTSLAIETVIDEDKSKSMVQTVTEWFDKDKEELSGLSAQLTAAVESALEDGIIDVNEQGAINALENKINNILSSWNERESQTQLDMIKQKYGHLTGADLTSGSFSEVIAEYQSQREAQKAEVEALSEQYYDMVNSAGGSGRLSKDEVTQWKQEWKKGVWSKEGSSIANALEFYGNTLGDTYGKEISNSKSGVSDRLEQIVAETNHAYETGTDFQYYVSNGAQRASGDAGGAVSELYEQMKPDVTAMQHVIDNYKEEFNEVPANIMQAYNEAIEIGAAAGDYDASTQLYANKLVESWDDSMKAAFKSGTDPVLASIEESSPELYAAISRALTPEGDEIEIDDIMAEIKDITFDASNVQELLSAAEKKAQKKIEEAGGTITAASDQDLEVTLDPDEITVNPGDTLSGIAAAVGMTVDELASYNSISDPNVIDAGITIKIPRDKISVDSDEVQAAISDAMSALTSEGAEMTITPEGNIEIDLSDVQVDNETATAQIEAALGMESGTLTANDISVATGASVTIPADLVSVDTSGISEAISSSTSESTETSPIEATADVSATAGNIDTSTARSEAEQTVTDVMGDTYYADGNADVTLTETNNVDEIYNQCDGEVRSRFADGFTATAPVTITLDYRISNPSASIALGGNASGTSTVTASIASNAHGGRIDGLTLSTLAEEGPEYVIPTTGRYKQRGVDLWYAAGEDLGMFDDVSQNADGAYVDESGNEHEASETTYNYAGVVDAPSNGSTGNTENNSPVTVQVNLNPVIQVSGDSMDEQKVFDVIKERVRELADDIGDEIAEQMTRIFDNMPVAEGA